MIPGVSGLVNGHNNNHTYNGIELIWFMYFLIMFCLFFSLKMLTNLVFNHRINLAALHTNCNAGRQQAETKDGTLCYSISFPKYKGGKHVVKPRMEKCRYGNCTILFIKKLTFFRFQLVTSPMDIQSNLGIKTTL